MRKEREYSLFSLNIQKSIHNWKRSYLLAGSSTIATCSAILSKETLILLLPSRSKAQTTSAFKMLLKILKKAITTIITTITITRRHGTHPSTPK